MVWPIYLITATLVAAVGWLANDRLAALVGAAVAISIAAIQVKGHYMSPELQTQHAASAGIWALCVTVLGVANQRQKSYKLIVINGLFGAVVLCYFWAWISLAPRGFGTSSLPLIASEGFMLIALFLAGLDGFGVVVRNIFSGKRLIGYRR